MLWRFNNVLHGSTEDFCEFSEKHISGADAIDEAGAGFYFTDVWQTAFVHALPSGYIYKCDVVMNNPLIVCRTDDFCIDISHADVEKILGGVWDSIKEVITEEYVDIKNKDAAINAVAKMLCPSIDLRIFENDFGSRRGDIMKLKRLITDVTGYDGVVRRIRQESGNTETHIVAWYYSQIVKYHKREEVNK